MRTGTIYDPQTWNKQPVVNTHNCYDYAMNNVENKNKTSQPGRKANQPLATKNEFTCPNISRLFHKDMRVSGVDIIKSKNGICPKGTRRVQLWVDPYESHIKNDNYDYHWYREDITGTWSHKPGKNKITNIDDSGNIIHDPKFSDRNYENLNLNYTDFCGEYCVPNRVNVD